MAIGFSLLEILVASIILVIVIVPLFGSLRTSHQGTGRIVEDSRAANLATSLLEKLAQVPYSRLPEIREDTPDSDIGRLFSPRSYAPFIEPYPGEYRRLVTVEQVSRRTDDPDDPANSVSGNLKLVRVKVVWSPDYLSRKSVKTMTFQTLVTDDTEVW
jgi:hypothetical protein